MIYLLLSIISSTLLVLIFKAFERFGVQSFPAIVFNYLTAATMGFILTPSGSTGNESQVAGWLPFAVFTGVMFIALFNVLSITIRKSGVSVGAVAQKMSVVIPVTFAAFAYQESFNIIKILGILLALTAIYLTSRKTRSTGAPGYLFWPVILFIGSGVVDTLLKYVDHHYIDSPEDYFPFVMIIFMVAAVIGVFVLPFRMKKYGDKINTRNILGGIILGIPNWASIYFLMKTLSSWLESSVVFPVNNVGIVLLSSIISFLVFKEHISRINFAGIIIAVLAILSITFSGQLTEYLFVF